MEGTTLLDLRYVMGIMDMYMKRVYCACAVLSLLFYPRLVRVWMCFWGLWSPWAVLSICVSLSRSPWRDPHRLMISYACVSRSSKSNCELNCVWLSVWSVFKHRAQGHWLNTISIGQCAQMYSPSSFKEKLQCQQASSVWKCLILLFILLY